MFVGALPVFRHAQFRLGMSACFMCSMCLGGLVCVKGVASVQARLVSFRHAHDVSHAVLRHAAVGIG